MTQARATMKKNTGSPNPNGFAILITHSKGLMKVNTMLTFLFDAMMISWNMHSKFHILHISYHKFSQFMR